MSRDIKRSDCESCYNEDYWHGLGGKNKCWSFDTAEMKLGRKQSIHTLPKHYKGQWKLIPDCYHAQRGLFIERKK